MITTIDCIDVVTSVKAHCDEKIKLYNERRKNISDSTTTKLIKQKQLNQLDCDLKNHCVLIYIKDSINTNASLHKKTFAWETNLNNTKAYILKMFFKQIVRWIQIQSFQSICIYLSTINCTVDNKVNVIVFRFEYSIVL